MFNEHYQALSKDVFLKHAQEQQAQGNDGLSYAQTYAEQGKPDFTLAHLLLLTAPDEIKQDLLARAFERRATLSSQKADELAHKHHRPFPLIKMEARKDLHIAQQIRQGKPVDNNDQTQSAQ